MLDRAGDIPAFVSGSWRIDVNRFFDILRNLLFPPKCACCRTLIPVVEEKYGGGLCLCRECRGLWNRAKEENCPTCLCPSHTCLCTEDKGSLKNMKIPKLLTYNPNVNNTQNKMIFSLKKVNDKRIPEFIASELSVSMGRYFKDNFILPDECVYTFVPRSRRAKGEFGFDQGQRLSREVARICEGKFEALFVRLGGREQKRLDSDMRARNISRSLRLKRNAEEKIRGRKIVVIDDLVTTGATLDGAVKLLKRAKAAEVYVACVARTGENKR